MKGKVKNMGNLGIIGGLGPMATAYFMQLLTQMSDAVAIEIGRAHV